MSTPITVAAVIEGTPAIGPGLEPQPYGASDVWYFFYQRPWTAAVLILAIYFIWKKCR